MPVDTSIYSNYLKPPPSVADFTSQSQGIEQNALKLDAQRQTMAEAAQVASERGALRNALSSGLDPTTPEGRVKLYQVAPTMAPGILKTMQDQLTSQAKAGLDTAQAGHVGAQTAQVKAQTAATALKQAATFVFANPTPENARRAVLQLALDQGGDPTADLQQLSQLTTPDQIKQWAAGHALQADKLLPTVQTRNTGATTDTLAINPLTGQAQVTGTVQNTQSPDSVASNAVQIRGQNLADARARETTAAAVTKPFEVTGPDGTPMLVQQDKRGNITPVEGFGPKTGASKPLTDSQAKALLFGTRAQESNKILDEIAGQYSPAALSTKAGVSKAPLIGGILGAAGNAMLSDKDQQAEQAQRDFVNAVLRRESGAVIAQSEFDNAAKQYFPQTGDSDAVLSQKRRNRELAISGMLAEVPEGKRKSITPAASQPSGGNLTPAEQKELEQLRARFKK